MCLFFSHGPCNRFRSGHALVIFKLVLAFVVVHILAYNSGLKIKPISQL